MEIYVESPGFVTWTGTDGQEHRARCALGRGGVGGKTGEGDGVTPVGQYPLRSVMIRSDRVAMPQTALPVSMIMKNDGWCDDPASPDYNKRVALPHAASHEELWRDDRLYDVIVEVGYNDDPVEAGRGSAIFMHTSRPDYMPTEGCIALELNDLLELLKPCNGDTLLVISP